MSKGIKLEKENFDIEVKYSKEAIEKKLVKFTLKIGNEIVLSADEIISMLVNQVNSEVLSAAFVESDRVNVVEVGRQIRCVLDRDFKKGEVININYSHPYPIEFALIEEAWKIAQINKDTKVTELTVEYIEEVKKKLKPEMAEYIKKFYQSFKTLNVNKNMEENQNVQEQTPVEETLSTAPEIMEAVPPQDAETVLPTEPAVMAPVEPGQPETGEESVEPTATEPTE